MALHQLATLVVVIVSFAAAICIYITEYSCDAIVNLINDGVENAEETLATMLDTMTDYMSNYFSIEIGICSTIGGSSDDTDECLDAEEVCDLYTEGMTRQFTWMCITALIIFGCKFVLVQVLVDRHRSARDGYEKERALDLEEDRYDKLARSYLTLELKYIAQKMSNEGAPPAPPTKASKTITYISLQKKGRSKETEYEPRVPMRVERNAKPSSPRKKGS